MVFAYLVLGTVSLACVIPLLLVAAIAARAGWTWLRLRGEVAEVPEGRADEMAVLLGDEITVPLVDGSHDHLPEDKATEASFWNLAKTAGIEAKR
jgi:hypothetical protein